jgi:hypothetical protein
MILDRSLKDETPFYEPNDENRLITLERLADGGYFRNTRLVTVNWRWPSVTQLSRVICYMTNLEKLSLLEWGLPLTKVPQLFRSCHNFTELRMAVVDRQKLEITEGLKNELRPGFQRLKIFELENWINSWPAIQEIFT